MDDIPEKDITTIQLDRTTKVKLVEMKSKLSLELGKDLTYDELLLKLLEEST